MFSTESLTSLIEPLLEERGMELVELQIVPGRRRTIRLYIDHVSGVSVGDCAQVSREISRKLDAAQPDVDNYLLEVSSPGMNRPVWTLEHFERFQGEELRFEMKEPWDGQVSFEGRIESVEGEVVKLRLADGRLLEVTVDALRSARLQIDPWQGRRKS